jgi:hypothetical protein
MKIIERIRTFVNRRRDSLRRVDVSSEFTRRLFHANAGMQDVGNLHAFSTAIRNLPTDHPIVEIGSFCGLSTNIIRHYQRQFGKMNPLFCSDKWEFEGAQPGKTIPGTNITYDAYRQFVKDNFMRNVRFFAADCLPYTVEVFSDEFFELWGARSAVSDVFGQRVQMGGGISFSYIDGNHTYDFARRDFENVDRFLDVGGYILFDDSADACPFAGVKHLMKELKQNPRYELALQCPNYLFRKRS